MFIKVLKKGKNSRESLFQCDRYSMWELGERDKPTVMLEIRGNEDIDLELIKEDHEVYILNDYGKTIDMFRWSK